MQEEDSFHVSVVGLHLQQKILSQPQASEVGGPAAREVREMSREHRRWRGEATIGNVFGAFIATIFADMYEVLLAAWWD